MNSGTDEFFASAAGATRVERMNASGTSIDWVPFKGPTIKKNKVVAIPAKSLQLNAAR